MAKRILIIQPSFYRSRADRTIAKVRRRDLVPLVLPYLAAVTPSDWEVHLPARYRISGISERRFSRTAERDMWNRLFICAQD